MQQVESFVIISIFQGTSVQGHVPPLSGRSCLQVGMPQIFAADVLGPGWGRVELELLS